MIIALSASAMAEWIADRPTAKSAKKTPSPRQIILRVSTTYESLTGAKPS